MTAAERIAACLLATRAKVTPDLVATIAAAESVDEVAAAFRVYAAARTAIALRKREIEQTLHADGWSRRAAKAEASHRLATPPQHGLL